MLGELDSGLATDWCRYFVWGNIMINANLTRLREREKVFSFSFSFSFSFLLCNLFMIIFLLYLHAYKGRPVMYK